MMRIRGIINETAVISKIIIMYLLEQRQGAVEKMSVSQEQARGVQNT